jgi:hypothetical protein
MLEAAYEAGHRAPVGHLSGKQPLQRSNDGAAGLNPLRP